jgi:hypothetical protein
VSAFNPHGRANKPPEPQKNFPRESDAEHTLKNYLAIILGYCDLLIGETDDDDPRRQDLLEIRRAAKGALALVNQERGR